MMSVILLVVVALTASAAGKGEIRKYFNTTATEVKATENPAEKRAILDRSLEKMTLALEMAQQSPMISDEDLNGIDRIKSTIREKQRELAGIDGYERVPDVQLNLFADYVVQDMEQADQIISVSLVTLLLIILIIVLLV
jgi:hypothetical protein